MGFREERRRRVEEKRLSDPTSVNIEFVEDDVSNLYAQTVDEGHKIDPRAQAIFIMCVVLAVVVIVGLLAPKYVLNPGLLLRNTTASGDHLTASYVVERFQLSIESFFGIFSGEEGSATTLIRYLVIAMAGGGLALSGAVYQGSFRNALVSPSTLGVMTGGQLGLTVWVVIVATLSDGSVFEMMYERTQKDGSDWTAFDYIATSLGLSICSFIGCFLVVGLVLLVMAVSGARSGSGVMMVVIGQIIGAVVGQVNNVIRYYFVTLDPYSDASLMLQELQVASFYREYGWIDFIAVAVPLAATFIVVMKLRNKMAALAFDASEQRTMGVDTKVVNVAVVGLCTLLTAIIISFCGAVGFVGFIVPHLARRIVGPDFKYLLPASVVLGGIFVLTAYVLLEITFGVDYASYTGIFISVLGAVVFLFTAVGGKGTANGSFLR